MRDGLSQTDSRRVCEECYINAESPEEQTVLRGLRDGRTTRLSAACEHRNQGAIVNRRRLGSFVANAASTDYLGTLLALSGLVVFGAFAWGVRGHFVSAKLPIGMKLILALSSLGLVGYLLEVGNASVPGWRRAAALGLQALAGGVFLWACAATRRHRPGVAFSRSDPVRVFKTGPFRFVRHPFYMSYLTFWAACTLATDSFLVKSISLLLMTIYIVAALQEQNAILSSALRPEYERYRSTTGFFWPRMRFWNRKTG
ncbi:MAG: isoprenylcysteine carboxylmethyltransferase family protein [Hyphomicrobiales bacterium]|nr:isoprenylcysteine carboxylmethyltransferase family protein [Hyphomicrobiales bacterium]